MELQIGTRQIPIQIDSEDYEFVRTLAGSLSVTTHGYVSQNVSIGNGKYRRQYLHRLLTQAPKGLFVDHINRNTTDNRRENLRVVTPAQSICNTRQRTGRFKGVYKDKLRQKWYVQVNHKYIGTYESEEEAALAYNEAARHIQGNYAFQNAV